MKIIYTLISTLVATIATLLILMGYINTVYATKESCNLSEISIQTNRSNIGLLENKTRNLGAILCGIAIDLKLPTARKECNNIITN